jgi:hypothetical protein
MIAACQPTTTKFEIDLSKLELAVIVEGADDGDILVLVALTTNSQVLLLI